MRYVLPCFNGQASLRDPALYLGSGLERETAPLKPMRLLLLFQDEQISWMVVVLFLGLREGGRGELRCWAGAGGAGGAGLRSEGEAQFRFSLLCTLWLTSGPFPTPAPESEATIPSLLFVKQNASRSCSREVVAIIKKWALILFECFCFTNPPTHCGLMSCGVERARTRP